METGRAARVANTWQRCFCVLLASACWTIFTLGGTPAHQALQGKGGGQEAAIVLASLPKPPAPTQSRSVSPPPGASQDWLAKVQETIREEEYHITWSEHTGLAGLPRAYQAPNRTQGFQTYFTDKGLKVVPRIQEKSPWEWTLGLNGSRPHAPTVNAGRAEYRTGPVTLTAENTPQGLALKWVINQAPEEEAANPGMNTLVVVPSGGSLVSALAEDGQSLDLRQTSGGMSTLHLGSLRATDAGGKSFRVVFSGSTPGRPGLSLATPEKSPAFPVNIEALVTSPSWTVEGNQTEANLGYSVGTAGDVNGDGYSDVIVGAVGYDNGQTDEGRAYVFLGGASGLSAAPAWTAEPDVAYSAFACSVGTAGDVNGDGYSDVIVGARDYTNGESKEGAAFVYLGSSGGLALTPAWTAESDQADAHLGMSVGTAGDVNGDGYSDVIAGAYFYDNGNTDEGRAFVYHGGPSGLSGSASWMAEGDQNSAYFGSSVATAGDVNGDGYSDVLVGASSYDNGQTDEGRVHLFHGSASGLLATPSWTQEADQASAYFGCSVQTAGDVNGDGYADVIVGALSYDNGQSDEGKAYVYLGGASGLSATPVWTAEADKSDSRFGGSVATAGDVNADGFADILVGAYFFSNPDSHEGKAYLYLGSSTGPSPIASWTLEGNQDQAVFGNSVGTAGDVNGDGYSDIIIGAFLFNNGETNEGRAYVFHGGPDDLGAASAWSSEGNQTNAYWGSSLASAGDVNGDGFEDFLVGSNGFDTAGGANAGKVELFLGSAGGADTTPDWTLEGTQTDGWLGVSVAGAGDVNGDGYADVLIGEAGFSNGQSREGRGLLFLGSATGLGGSPDWTFESNLTYRTLGNPVASAGDVNGDGYADVILGAPTLWDCHCPGRAYLFHGSPAGLASSPDWTATSDQAEAWFGNSVGSAGDVNADGYSDVFVAEYAFNGQAGRVFVWHGSASGLGDAGTPANFDWSATSDGEAERFGWRAAGAGDVNGDGYSDLLVGATDHSSGQYHEGRVCLFQGSASGLSAAPSWAAESDQADAQFGYGLSGGGDWNGDGYSDFAAGALAFDGSAGANCGKAWAFYGSASGPSAPAATTWEGIQAGEYFGLATASAGDVDGDGRADLLICAQGYDNGESDEGRVALYFGGGGGGGIALKSQQRRYDDSVPIAHLGKSDERDGFRLAAEGRSPFGRGKVRLQTEVKPFGTAFDGTDLQTTAAWTDSGVAGAALTNVVDSLEIAGGYHWRARILYDPVTLPFQVAGRWFGPPVNGWEEMDLRMVAEAEVRVTSFTDSPDPVNNSQDLTYSLSVENDGPDSADGVAATLALTHPGASLTFVAGASDPRWSWNSGTSTLSADLGTMADGASTTLDAVFTVSGSGSIGADAAVTSAVGDPNGGNNSATVSTTIAPSADLAITGFTDAPDPVLVGDNLTYTLSIINNGPDASSVTATEAFTPTGTTLSFVPASSDGRWTWDSGTRTLTATLGSMAGGATDSLLAVFTADAPGSIAAQAVLTPTLFDPNPVNNVADATTTSCVIPGAFDLLHPASGVSNLSTSAAFYWQPSAGAATYDLRLGTTTPPPLHTSGITGTETSVTGLAPGTTYYWDMEARTPCGTTLSTGGPRSFTTSCPTEMGRWPDKPYGTVRSSVISGNYAYYGNGLLLTVLDISNPASPVLVKEVPLPGEVDEGEPLVESGYLFLPLTNGTLKIYNLADPESPAEIASLGGFAGLRGGMEFYGGLLYLADQTAGLRVVSLSPITAPSIIGSLATSHARDLTIYEKSFTKYAYVVEAYDGLVVMNVTNPASPALINSVPLGGDWAESVARAGDYLCVADSTYGFKVFSIANPALPVQVGIYPSPNYTEWVLINGSTAYVCDGQGGLLALDISTPSSPAFLGEFDTPGTAMHVVLQGTTALVGDDFGGLRVLDVSNPAAISEMAHLDLSETSTLGIWSDGSRAFAARYNEGLASFDVSTPAAPTERTVLTTLDRNLCRAVTVDGTLAYVSDDYDGLAIVDVSDPGAPAEVGSYDWGNNRIYHSVLNGSTAYVAAGAYGLAILDVSDPAHPVELGRYDTPGSARFVALVGAATYALVADYDQGLRIVDVSNPSSPTSIGSIGTAGNAVAVAVASSGNLAYVAASSAGLRIIELSNPATPVEAAFYDTPGTAQGVEVWGSMAIVADGSAGAHLIDVSNPWAPVLVATLDTPGTAREAHLVGYSLFIADSFGFLIEDLATCSTAPPVAFSLNVPAPGALATPCGLTLDWDSAAGAYRYDLFLDTVNPPVAKVASDLTESQWWTAGLTPGTTYYWKVDAKNGFGVTSSAIGSFTTAPIPGAFDLISPVAGASEKTTAATLFWNPSAGAQSYSLYFGETDPPPLLASDLFATSYALTGLNPGATYYWYVEARTHCGATPSTDGPRSFTTTCATLAGRWPSKPYGPLRSSAINGTYAYAANGLVLAVLDISTPSSPSVVREIDLPGEVDEGEMLVAGGYLYVPMSGSLKFYSVSDPSSPWEVANLPLWGIRGGMELAGDLLYAADGTNGLKIINVSTPSAPTVVGSLPGPLFDGNPDEARDVTVYTTGPTTYAYVPYYYTGIQVIDVTNPASPSLVTTLTLENGMESVGRVGTTLVAGGGDGVTLYDLTNPAAPTLITTWLTSPTEPFYVEWITLSGSTAFVCDSNLGLHIVDLSIPASPVVLGNRAPRGLPFHIALSGTMGLLAEDFAGLTLLDVSSPSSIVQLGSWDASQGLSTGLSGIWSDGARAFIGLQNEGLAVLDVSVPSMPAEIGTWPLPHSLVYGVTVRDNLAFVADRLSSLYILDVTSPSAPLLVGTYAKNGFQPTLSEDGQTLYYASGAGGLYILDISTPSAPVLLGRWAHPSPCVGCSARSVALDWPYAFLADGTGGLRVIDVSNPAAPSLLATASTSGNAWSVAYSEGHVYVPADMSFDIFDVSSPSTPTMQSTLSIPTTFARVNLAGSVATVGVGPTGVLLIDISNPSTPSILRTVDTPGQAGEALIVGDSLHVADRYGVVIEDLGSCCSGPPSAPDLLSPLDGTTEVSTSLKLDWSDPQWVLRYDLYLDTANPPVTMVDSGIKVSSKTKALLPGTQYYWRVVAHSPCGATHSGIFSFTTAPPDLEVTIFSDLPDPVLTGRAVTYTLAIENDSPNLATGIVTETLSPAAGVSLIFDAGSSDLRWVWDSGAMTLTAQLGLMPPGGTETLTAVFTTAGVGTVSNHASVVGSETEPDLSDNEADATTQVAPLAIGDSVWRDDDADGIQDPGEPGLAGVVVKLYNASYQMLQEVVTDPSGAYQFSNLTYGATHMVKFFLPSADYVFSPRDQGSDDEVDSDADTITGQTGFFALTDGLDPSRWDCGMISGSLCVVPDEPVYIYSVTLTTDGHDYPILNFMDANQANQVTGYNVYRTHDPALPHNEWPQVASDVVDMDEATLNKQWIDTSGDDPPTGYSVWYYQVTAYNHRCPAEGPW